MSANGKEETEELTIAKEDYRSIVETFGKLSAAPQSVQDEFSLRWSAAVMLENENIGAERYQRKMSELVL